MKKYLSLLLLGSLCLLVFTARSATLEEILASEIAKKAEPVENPAEKAVEERKVVEERKAVVHISTLEEIKKNGNLRVCLEPLYTPFEMINKQGEVIGFDVDLAELMAKELGASLKIVNTARGDIIPALIANKCDIIVSGMTITGERRQKIDFSNAYMSIGQTVLLRKELSDKVKSYKDLNDPAYKVASKSGTTGEAAVKSQLPKVSYKAFESERDAMIAVVEGKIDAFIYDSPYNTVAFEQYGADKVVFLESPFTIEHLGFGVRKGDPEFLEWLNNFSKKIASSGDKYRLYRKWMKNTSWIKDLKD